MTNNKKRYHLTNAIVIPLTVLSGILLTKMGQMADVQQISMSSPGMTTLSGLLFVILGGGVIWIGISTVLNKNIRGMLTKTGFKKPVVIIGIFVIVIAFRLLLLPLAIAVAVLAVYLFINSYLALATKNFDPVPH